MRVEVFLQTHYDRTRMHEVRVVIRKDRQGGSRRENKEGSNLMAEGRIVVVRRGRVLGVNFDDGR